MKRISQKTRRIYLNRIIKSGKKVYRIKLQVGLYDPAELNNVVDNMAQVLNRMFNDRRTYRYASNFTGILKRILFEFDTEKELVRPYVYLIAVAKRSEVDDFKIKLKTYVNWLTAWARTLKTCINVYVDMDLIDPNEIESVFNHFFEIETYLSSLSETDKAYIARAIGNHQLYGIIGDFFKTECIER